MIDPGRIEADPEAVTDGQWTRETGGGVLSWVGIAIVVLIVAMLLDSESLSNLSDQILAEMKVLVSAHPVEGAVIFFIFSASPRYSRSFRARSSCRPLPKRGASPSPS